jgi:hypothetical protein
MVNAVDVDVVVCFEEMDGRLTVVVVVGTKDSDLVGERMELSRRQ